MNATRVPRTFRVLVVSIVLLAFIPVAASAPSGGVSQWVRETKAHQISGYVTLGLATTTAIMGIAGYEYHPIAGVATAASSVVSLSLGSLAYSDQLGFYWPHAVLAGIATAGFVTSVFFLDGGSTAHIATGVASTVTLFSAYGAILLLTRL
ncbi:MAG: hypothetical protein ACOC1U_08000 [Spirochaetota bacterium]